MQDLHYKNLPPKATLFLGNASKRLPIHRIGVAFASVPWFRRLGITLCSIDFQPFLRKPTTTVSPVTLRHHPAAAPRHSRSTSDPVAVAAVAIEHCRRLSLTPSLSLTLNLTLTPSLSLTLTPPPSAPLSDTEPTSQSCEVRNRCLQPHAVLTGSFPLPQQSSSSSSSEGWIFLCGADVVSNGKCAEQEGIEELAIRFFSTRLPLVEGSSFVYLAPALVILNTEFQNLTEH
ncbi:hypothetical protein PIB30_085850, partial [Stylosanthes scabra]|nr:hypothetical protein [Stylosanthes scabra]